MKKQAAILGMSVLLLGISLFADNNRVCEDEALDMFLKRTSRDQEQQRKAIR